jgi:hypothetical protein
MRYSRLLIWASLSILLMIPVMASTAPPVLFAQADADTCTQIVESALDTANEVCDGTGRNQACYGHDMLSAEPQPGFGPFNFSEAGDTVNVAHLNNLRLSPMDLETGTWGVALLELQADIPDDHPQNVSLLLFGDVEVENLVQEPVLMDAVVDSDGNTNVRKEPDNTAFVMATLRQNATVTARGRSEDGDWIYIDLPNREDVRGWVSTNLLNLTGNVSDLNIVDPGFTQYGPMQAFYLETGDNQTTCAEAPSDGLLVQTPEGVAEIRLWINEVKIRLGSTAFIQAHSGNTMTINTLEGAAHVEAFGVEQVAVAGTGVTIQLNNNSGAAAPPSMAKPYEAGQVDNLPTQNLVRPITPVVETTPEVTQPIQPTAVPSDTSAPPTDTSAPPTDTSVPPTDTSAPPTDTSAPPTDTSEPPTSEPPTSEPPTSEPLTDSPPATVESSGSGSGPSDASPATEEVSGSSTEQDQDPTESSAESSPEIEVTP